MTYNRLVLKLAANFLTRIKYNVLSEHMLPYTICIQLSGLSYFSRKLYEFVFSYEFICSFYVLINFKWNSNKTLMEQDCNKIIVNNLLFFVFSTNFVFNLSFKDLSKNSFPVDFWLDWITLILINFIPQCKKLNFFSNTNWIKLM